MCICIPNMKFLWLILWQGEVCTDANANDNDDGQSMIVKGSLVDKPNETKTEENITTKSTGDHTYQRSGGFYRLHKMQILSMQQKAA